MSNWTTQPIFDSLGIFGLVAIVLLAATLLILPQSDRLSPRQRNTLRLIRLFACLVLLLSMLRPTRVHTTQQPTPATLAILLDGSRSMTLTASGSVSRWQVQRDVWREIEPILNAKDETLRIAVYRYVDALQSLDPSQGEVADFLNAPPAGELTDIAGALQETVTLAAGNPLAGIVLIGDGTQTASVQTGPQAIAQTLAALEVPLWTVPIGPSQDASTARDVALDAMPDQFSVFAKNLFEVTANLSAHGLDNRTIPIDLVLTDASGKSQTIAQRTFTIRGGDDDQRIAIEIPAPAPGNYRLDLVAPSQDGEILTANNRQSAFLDVRDGGGRVLYLEGQPRVEQLFLRRSIAASEDFELSFQWIERTAGGANWPVDLGTVFEADRFDIYILGDLAADALGQQQLVALQQRIKQGAGLLMLGGFHSFDAGGYGDSALAEVLPVKMNAGVVQAFGSEPDPELQLAGPVKTRIAKPHPINQIAVNEDAQAAWNRLRPLKGANRLLGPKPIPGVEVLLQSDADEPLLVVGDYGQGRAAAFAGDSTWQWWRQGQQDLHRRFWRQVLLWLMRRDTSADDEIDLQMDRRRFAKSDEVSFQASIVQSDESASPVKLQAEVVDADGKSVAVPINQSTQRDGRRSTWTGTLTSLEDGFYRLRVSDTRPDSGLKGTELAFQVLSIDRELSRPIADVAQMQQLAAVTESVGGRSIPPNEVASLRELIEQNRRRSVTPIIRQWRFGDEPISGWITMLVFGGLLTTDWVLRKRWGLV
ncbi:MAG: glutamine amidotransferase [Pirellulaceae bacterium]